MRTITFSVLLFVVFILGAIPTEIPFQGRLVDDVGNARKPRKQRYGNIISD